MAGIMVDKIVSPRVNESQVSQHAYTAEQLALIDLKPDREVKPAMVAKQSSGQIAYAYLEDTSSRPASWTITSQHKRFSASLNTCGREIGMLSHGERT